MKLIDTVLFDNKKRLANFLAVHFHLLVDHIVLVAVILLFTHFFSCLYLLCNITYFDYISKEEENLQIFKSQREVGSDLQL